jgi:SHS2 domain-containing protein
MTYRYLEKITTADVAFQAYGKSLEVLFLSAWDATLNVMVSNIETIKRKILKTVRIANSAIELLLFDFLQELLFFKDAERLLLRINSLHIGKTGETYGLRAEAAGEIIDSKHHELLVDVKAVTFYRFCVEQVSSGWRATVTLDV